MYYLSVTLQWIYFNPLSQHYRFNCITHLTVKHILNAMQLH